MGGCDFFGGSNAAANNNDTPNATPDMPDACTTALGVTCAQFAEAYLKASNTEASDDFGWSVALSGDTLAVGARYEDSDATGVSTTTPTTANNSANDSGAVYVFTRSGSTWGQQAYFKASNTGAGDEFGWSVALSGSGNTLAVGARYEDSSATGVNGNQRDRSALLSGAVYVRRIAP